MIREGLQFAAEQNGPCLIFCAGNEPKSVLARDLGDCRDNLRNSRSVFLIVAEITMEGLILTETAADFDGQKRNHGNCDKVKSSKRRRQKRMEFLRVWTRS